MVRAYIRGNASARRPSAQREDREVLEEIERTHAVPGESLFYFMREPSTLLEALDDDSLSVVHMTTNPELGDALEIDRHTGRVLARGQRPVAVEFDVDDVIDVYKVLPVYYVQPGRLPPQRVLDYYRSMGACDIDPASCDKDRIARLGPSDEVGFFKGQELAIESEWVNVDEEISGDLALAIKHVYLYRESLEYEDFVDEDTAETFRDELIARGVSPEKIVIVEESDG